MKNLKCGVIGLGYLGKFHAQKYQLIPNAELVGVADIDATVGRHLSEILEVPFYHDYHELLTEVDAVSIVSTTPTHFQIAKTCLLQGIHVLLEKPITETVAEASELVDLAEKSNLILQIGHLERFNKAYIYLNEYLNEPFYLDAQRLSVFQHRGTEVSVVLDLMIHDLDIILSLTKAPVSKIEAFGTAILSKNIDFAQAKIQFENNLVASVTASRVNNKAERFMRVFQNSAYFLVDYQDKSLSIYDQRNLSTQKSPEMIIKKDDGTRPSDALLDEIKEFIWCIQSKALPQVSGQAGTAALELALKINHLIKA